MERRELAGAERKYRLCDTVKELVAAVRRDEPDEQTRGDALRRLAEMYAFVPMPGKWAHVQSIDVASCMRKLWLRIPIW